MRIVMLGDIVGRPGRRVVQQQLPAIRSELQPDLILANAENIAGGSGITDALYQRLISYGIDGVTLGDHVYRQKGIAETLARVTNMTRPANLPRAAAGHRSMTLKARDGSPVTVITVLGRLFMAGAAADDPFACVDEMLDTLRPRGPVIVEVHAEATSEKAALAHYLDGHVAAVIGTHTHIPTADAAILPGGTAFITDIGMCGPYDSVIGRRKDRVVYHMTTGMPTPFDVAPDSARTRLCGVVIDLDASGKATRIERLQRDADMHRPPFTDATQGPGGESEAD